MKIMKNKDMWKQLKKYLLDFFCLSFGLLICGYIFYIHVLMNRIPRELSFSWDSYSFIWYMIFFLLNIYFLFKKIYTNESKNKIIMWVAEKILLKIFIFYENSLENVYELVMKSSYIRDLIYNSIYIVKDFCELKFMRKENSLVMVYYLIILFPRILVVLTFFVDVIIFNKMFYMYKIIWILIIPLIFRIYYYMLENFCLYYVRVIVKYFRIRFEKDEKQIYVYCDEIKDSKFRKDFPISKEQEESIRKDLIYLYVVRNDFLDVFSTDGPIASAPVYKKITTIISILYTIIWGYTLCRMIINIPY